MNIFVANFPDLFGKKEVAQLFEPHGKVKSAKVIQDKESGSSRCFGFVEMPDVDEANNAMKELNDSLVDGQKITVVKAKIQKEKKILTDLPPEKVEQIHKTGACFIYFDT